MKTCIHDKGAVEAVEKSNPPPAPPPAGDRMDLAPEVITYTDEEIFEKLGPAHAGYVRGDGLL